jgi:transglutaminase-like putative cysteine protease
MAAPATAAPRAGTPPPPTAAVPLAAAAPQVAGLVRLAAFVLLAVYCTQQWAGQVAPAGRWQMLAGVAFAAALAALGPATAAWPVRRRAAVLAAGGVVAVAGVLLVCGVPLRLLRPDRWDELASGIGQGLDALPQLRVPYRGADEWIRTVVLTGGGLLAVLAALAGFGPRRWAAAPAPGARGPALPGSPLAAAVVLGLTYAVPVIARAPQHPYLSGAGLAVALAAFLWADRLEPARAPAAAALAGVAVLAALALAPRVDGRSAWVDVESLAGKQQRTATAFDWNHTYAALDWPRRGTEALRIDAPSGGYWKGVTLTRFDGLRWAEDRYWRPGTPDTEQASLRREWYQRVRVVARGIDSAQLYAPGEVLDIQRFDRDWAAGPGGTAVAVQRHLRPGDSYVAWVYAPRPSTTEMQGAGTDYPPFTREDLTIQLPLRPLVRTAATRGQPMPSPAATNSIEFPIFGEPGSPRRVAANGAYPDGVDVLAGSDYARLYKLARRLRSQAGGPYDLIQRVIRRVRQGATYTEDPPPARVPLDDFVFGSRQGYCQEFSGATALLLRMAGVPARVASGFAPGTYDRARKEFVVRDLDAHSWVEVYFPRIGWVSFDPTPASAPPASQSDLAEGASAVIPTSTSAGGGGLGDAVGHSAGSGSSGGGGLPAAGMGLGALALAALAGGAALIRRRARDEADHDEAPALAELRRALTRSGRAPEPAMTLRALEQHFAGSQEAQGYVRDLRLARYAGTTGPAPSGAGRAALRRELGAGLGLRGRLRAWWAVPPRLPDRAWLQAALRRLRGRRRPSRAV